MQLASVSKLLTRTAPVYFKRAEFWHRTGVMILENDMWRVLPVKDVILSTDGAKDSLSWLSTRLARRFPRLRSV